MSRGNWLVFIVVGCVIGFLIASKYAPLLDGPVAYYGQSNSQKADQESAGQQADPTQPDTARETFRAENGTSDTAQDSYPQPNDHLFLGDGWAQWTMVAASIAALFVSVWAVGLLQKTLTATRDTIRKAEDANRAAQDAVNATREIGQAQVQPYLTYELGKLGTTEENDKLILILTVENCGQSPARFFCAKKVAVWAVLVGETTEVFRHASAADQHWLLTPGLKAGGDKIISVNLRLRPDEVAKITEWMLSGQDFVVNVSGIFTWKTPFGEDAQPFTFNQMGAEGNFIYDMITEDYVEARWRMAQIAEGTQDQAQQ